MSTLGRIHPGALPSVAPSPFFPPRIPERRGVASVGITGTGSTGEVGTSGFSTLRARDATQISLVGPATYDPATGLARDCLLLIVVDAGGAQVAAQGGVIMDRADCIGSDGKMHTLRITEIEVCMPNGDGTFTRYNTLTLMSDLYNPH